MDKTDLTAALSMAIDDMEGAQGDSHEIFMRIHQILQTMRAEGLPVPEDLAALEKELGDRFEAEAAEAKE
jgi:hypothetical protein